MAPQGNISWAKHLAVGKAEGSMGIYGLGFPLQAVVHTEQVVGGGLSHIMGRGPGARLGSKGARPVHIMGQGKEVVLEFSTSSV